LQRPAGPCALRGVSGAPWPRTAVRLKARIAVALAAIALIGLGAWQWEWDVSRLEAWIGEHSVLGAIVYFVFVAASVVLLPFSSLPLLPLAAHSYGVVLTALLSAAGWWAGCLLAFQIARFGRRYLERITSLQAVDRLEEKVPEDIGFGGIVVLRMILPVDVVSFALGLLRRLRFRTYAVASLVGILPFAFVWSYAGGELDAGRYLTFAFVVLGMAVVVLLARRAWKAHR
jgi:uncharacterized membrane protein YdjX (TVP38/TMEM64 family)